MNIVQPEFEPKPAKTLSESSQFNWIDPVPDTSKEIKKASTDKAEETGSLQLDCFQIQGNEFRF